MRGELDRVQCSRTMTDVSRQVSRSLFVCGPLQGCFAAMIFQALSRKFLTLCVHCVTVPQARFVSSTLSGGEFALALNQW